MNSKHGFPIFLQSEVCMLKKIAEKTTVIPEKREGRQQCQGVRWDFNGRGDIYSHVSMYTVKVME